MQVYIFFIDISLFFQFLLKFSRVLHVNVAKAVIITWENFRGLNVAIFHSSRQNKP